MAIYIGDNGRTGRNMVMDAISNKNSVQYTKENGNKIQKRVKAS
jgi:hypothetical protein